MLSVLQNGIPEIANFWVLTPKSRTFHFSIIIAYKTYNFEANQKGIPIYRSYIQTGVKNRQGSTFSPRQQNVAGDPSTVRVMPNDIPKNMWYAKIFQS